MQQPVLSLVPGTVLRDQGSIILAVFRLPSPTVAPFSYLSASRAERLAAHFSDHICLAFLRITRSAPDLHDTFGRLF